VGQPTSPARQGLTEESQNPDLEMGSCQTNSRNPPGQYGLILLVGRNATPRPAARQRGTLAGLAVHHAAECAPAGRPVRQPPFHDNRVVPLDRERRGRLAAGRHVAELSRLPADGERRKATSWPERFSTISRFCTRSRTAHHTPASPATMTAPAI